MMGIRFAGHPDLRRILMWEGYPYYPLRKDFPLEGKPSEMPDVAFTDPIPLEGGPFVTLAGGEDAAAREPRVRKQNKRMAEYQNIQVSDSIARSAQAMDELQDVQGEKMTLNMGPSHPATHGVLRLSLELDGEIIVKAVPEVGYLHRGDEKIAENMTYSQFLPYTDRLDYLAPLSNNVAYALAVEKLLGVDSKLPERCQYISVICCELARISAHLLGLGAYAMDVGALTVFLHTFNEREKIYNLIEALTGARLTTSYTRIGGLSRDLPEGWTDELAKFNKEILHAISEADQLLTRNKIFLDRTKDVGIISKEEAIDFGLSGPNLRGSNIEYDIRKAQPYLVYDQLDFDIPYGEVGDCYDRYLIRMEEMRQSVRILDQCLANLPTGPISIDDGKIVLPNKQKVLSSMEELIHQFMLVTQGQNAPKVKFTLELKTQKVN